MVRQTNLTREAIATEALAIADREGIDALTMRRVAERLGVGTMTLYGYFRSKDELIDAALDVATADAPRRRHERGSWKDELRAVLQGAYRNLQRHPSLVQLRLRRPLITSRQLRFTEAGVTILEDAGLAPDEAARAFRSLFFYVFGFAAFSADTDAARAEMRTAVAALDPATHPRLTASIEHVVAVVGGADQFDYGLDLLLDGIAARLPPRARRPAARTRRATT